MSKWISDITETVPILVVSPMEPPVSRQAHIALPGVKIEIKDTSVPINGIITGHIKVERPQVPLKSISLQLKEVEKLKIFGTSKDQVKISPPYELIDQSPKPDVNFSFVFCLKQFKISPIPKGTSRIVTQYYLIAKIVDVEGKEVSREEKLTIYEPNQPISFTFHS